MTHNAEIYTHNDSLHIEISTGYGDYIELRTGDDLLELLRDLITAGNAHFGTTARLTEAGGELNVAQLLSDDDFPAVASSPDAGVNPGTVHEVAGDAPYRDPADDGTGYILVGMPKYGVSVGGVGSQPRQDYTWADFRREHLAQFEAMVEALPTTEKAPYTWAEYQAANKQALDEIAAFVGGKRE